MNTMRTHHVVPTPTNYAVFFTYTAGQTGGIVQEVDGVISQKKPFTEEFLDRLYATYVAEPQAQAMRDTAAGAKRILSEIMQSVSHFSGETSSMGTKVQQQLENLDGELDEEAIRLLANALIQSAQTLQSNSEMMTQRLERAQQEISELRENLARTITESERDFLTGTFNRKAFDARLNESIAAAKQDGTPLTLLMFDIDHFKHFNDHFGHLIGDEVLKIVARTLIDMLKGMDCVARYGGEEFAVILPKTPLGGGMIIAEAIRKSIASKELKRKSSGENFGTITVSIGVATLRHQDDSATSLIARADEALYRSKHAGRNRVTQEVLSK